LRQPRTKNAELPEEWSFQEFAGSKTGIRKSKTSRWRAAALILLNLFMIAHIIQWRVGGKTVSPIEPSEIMHTLQKGFLNAGFIFFTLAILATLIFGRYVCGWGCHILALQDLCGWLLKKMGFIQSRSGRDCWCMCHSLARCTCLSGPRFIDSSRRRTNRLFPNSPIIW